MRPGYRLTHPPRAVLRARRDNLALVPGSLFPYIQNCQRVANRLPQGGVLIALPKNSPAQKRTLLSVANLLAQEGHQVRVMPAAELEYKAADEHSDLDHG